MAVPTTYRWIAVGKLSVRNNTNAPQGAAIYTLANLIQALQAVENSPNGQREYQNQDRRMWCTPIRETNEYYLLLIQIGDKRIADAAYIDFLTGASRDGGKLESEGGHFCSHVIIRKQSDALRRHLLLLEKVPGIYFSALVAHFNWILRTARRKRFATVDGERKLYRGITEIGGHQSRTLSDVMASGVVLDLQLVGNERREAGLDENNLVRATSHEVRLDIRRRVNADGARRLIRLGIDKFNGWEQVEQDSRELLVRIKSDDGQTRTVSVTPEDEDIEAATEQALESAFCLNEIVNDFTTPLTQRYTDIRNDMIEIMIARAGAFE